MKLLTYAEYNRGELNGKGEKTGKALGEHVIKLYSNGISQVVKTRNVKRDYSRISEMIRASKTRWLT